MTLSGYPGDVINVQVNLDRLLPVNGDHTVNLKVKNTGLTLMNGGVPYSNNERTLTFDDNPAATTQVPIQVALNKPGLWDISTEISANYYYSEDGYKIEKDTIPITVLNAPDEGWYGGFLSVMGYFQAGWFYDWSGSVAYKFTNTAAGTHIRINLATLSNPNSNYGAGVVAGLIHVKVFKPDGSTEIVDPSYQYICTLVGGYRFLVAMPYITISTFYLSLLHTASFNFYKGGLSEFSPYVLQSISDVYKVIGLIFEQRTTGPGSGSGDQNIGIIDINEGNTAIEAYTATNGGGAGVTIHSFTTSGYNHGYSFTITGGTGWYVNSTKLYKIAGHVCHDASIFNNVFRGPTGP